jgi:antitoxin component of RelBE/YafQ-DinJ toxin-antitoxin module
MNRVTLQVPISKEIKLAAQDRAEAMGFSSLQEAVRIFLYRLAKGYIDIQLEEKDGKFYKSDKVIER